jgi:hypothetical protein
MSLTLTSVASVVAPAVVGTVVVVSNTRLMRSWKELIRSATPADRHGEAERVDLLIVSTLPLAIMAFVTLRAAFGGGPPIVGSIGALLGIVSAATLAQLGVLRNEVSK